MDKSHQNNSPKQVWIHTGNPSAKKKMWMCAKMIWQAEPSIIVDIKSSDSLWWLNNNLTDS